MYFHAPFIAATPGLRLATVVTRDPGRAAQVQAEYPGAIVRERATDVWAARDEYDLVVVAAPNAAHVSLATEAIHAGLPVVVDKPLAVTSAEARSLIALARDRGVRMTVFQNRRHDGDFQTLRRLLADGTLGDPLRFESRFERWRPVPKGGWRESGAAEAGGGLLMDLGSHLIDQALELFGPAATVYGELDRRRPGIEVDDDVFVAVTHVSGVRSHLWMSVLA
jgi:predicted dehydrogenase